MKTVRVKQNIVSLQYQEFHLHHHCQYDKFSDFLFVHVFRETNAHELGDWAGKMSGNYSSRT